MSASFSQPAAPEAVLRQAGDLGRRHGRAAVYWQIGDSSSGREFYQELLRGIASADPEVMSPYATPDLTARWDYERGNLAADLQLADGDPALDQAAEAYLGAAREEFWLEAARLARRRLTPGTGDETAYEDEDGTGSRSGELELPPSPAPREEKPPAEKPKPSPVSRQAANRARRRPTVAGRSPAPRNR